jgi:probable rRNA maturation factor
MRASQQKPRSSLHVEIIEEDGDWSRLADAEAVIRRAADAVARESQGVIPGGTLSVALSSDAQVADLNGRFRGKPKPTNVLSFPAGPGAADGHLGDIVMAYETVAREANEQGIAFADHVQHLVVHGILHLLGYDHLGADDAERMEALEIKILSGLGIANPYTGVLETGTND